jgi:ABC-type multidrug transport system fused ATPase/permease subunit
MQSKQSFFKRTLVLFRPFWKHFTVVVALLFLIQGIGVFSPYLFGRGVDAVTHKDAQKTFYFLLIAFGAAFLRSIFLWWYREVYQIKYLDNHVEGALSVHALKKMFSFSAGQHINEHSGVKQTIINRGQNSLVHFVNMLFYSFLPTAVQILVTLGILAFFDWRIALTAFFFVAVYVFISYRRNINYFPKIDQLRKKHQEQSKLQSELFRNSTLVISEAQEENASYTYEKKHEEVVNFDNKVWLSFLKVFYAHRTFVVIGQYATLALGTYLILIGQHSIGMFVSFFSWSSSIFDNLTSIMSQQRQMLFQMVEIKKMYDLFDIKPDIDLNANGKVIEPLRGEIEFKNVSFAYPYRKSAKQEQEEGLEINQKEKDHAVSNVSFKIPVGAKVGFVGISGSGKSTIVNLMRRYYAPSAGEILIDGVNINEINLRWLRSKIGNVEQKIELFDRSIRENILFGLSSGKKATEEELKKAVKDASLDEFISKLKDHGLDTMIGEGGIKVSGGERQRIGIARALIKDPKILIFDEATSALDSINEKLIHDAINRGAVGRTTVIIAHRLSTIKDADKIFVVANGKIVGEGTHTKLLRSCKEYKDLLEHQVFVL